MNTTREGTIDDLPEMIRIVSKDMREEMNWDDSQVEGCLRAYLKDKEVMVGLTDNKINFVALG